MKNDNFLKYLNSQVDKYTSAELPGVWKALLRQCNMGNIAAIKLLFDMKGMNPEFAHKKDVEHQRLDIERKKHAILEAKAGGGGDDIPDDGFLEAMAGAVKNIWKTEENG